MGARCRSQEFSHLSKASAVPLSYTHVVTDVAKERVIDKSSVVRKQALHLLGTLLDCNPYNSQLSEEIYAEKARAVEEWLDVHKDDEGEKETVARKAEFLAYCHSAVAFIKKIEAACAECCKLLSSKSTSDVVESVRFFVKAQKFKISGASEGLAKMLGLVWDVRDSGAAKKELMLAFEAVYLKCDEGCRRKSDWRSGRRLQGDLFGRSYRGVDDE